MKESSETVRVTPSAAPHVVIVERLDTWLDDVEQEVKATFLPGTVVERPTYGYFAAVSTASLRITAMRLFLFGQSTRKSNAHAARRFPGRKNNRGIVLRQGRAFWKGIAI